MKEMQLYSEKQLDTGQTNIVEQETQQWCIRCIAIRNIERITTLCQRQFDMENKPKKLFLQVIKSYTSTIDLNS